MSATVSIVVPAYNNADHIDDTMRSVLAQTHAPLEVIVADHGSEDGTWERLQRYVDDPRVTLLRTPPGGGARANWNRVSAAATGEYLKLVCGDDVIDPDLVSRQVALFDDGIVLAATSRAVVDADGREIIRDRGLGPLTGRVEGRTAIRATVRHGTNLFGEPACVLMRRETLVSTGLWADAEYLLDEATYVNVLEHGDFVGLREPLARFRLSAGQWSVRLATRQARQARAFHHALRHRMPDTIGWVDVACGDVLATVNAVARRVVYAWLGRRMTRGSAT